MKGIKKLFFGLIFMTLVGVGFKVDVNAATPSAKLIAPKGGWSEGNYATITFSGGEFPRDDEVGEDEVVSNEYDVAAGDFEAVVSYCKAYVTDTKKEKYIEVKVDDIVIATVYNKTSIAFDTNIDRNAIYELLPDSSVSTKVVSIYPYINDEQQKEPLTVKACKVIAKAKPTGRLTAEVEFTFSDDEDEEKDQYLLTGDHITVSAKNDDDLRSKGYTPKWSCDKNGKLLGEDDQECVVECLGKEGITVEAYYTVDKYALEIYGLEGRTVAKGKNVWSDEMEVKTELGDLSEAKVFLDQVQLTEGTDYTLDEESFKFSAYKGSHGKHVLKIKVGDAEFKWNVRIVDPNKLNLSMPKSITTYVGYSVKYTPKFDKTYTTIKDYDVEYVPDADDFVTAEGIDGTSLLVIGDAETKSAKTIKITPVFDADSYDESGEELVLFSPTPVSVTVKKASPGTINHIYVNKDQKIKLSKFAKDFSPSSLEVSVTNKASDYISVSPEDGSLDKIEITGNKAGTTSNGIEVTPAKNDIAKANVTVYDKPSITKKEEKISSNANGSSQLASGTKYSLTITMPKGDYHDDIFEEKLDKTEIVLKSSGTEKVIGTQSLSNNSYTYTVTDKELAEMFGNKEGSVTLYAYAYPGKRDDKVYAEYSWNYSSSSSSQAGDNGGGSTGGGNNPYDDMPETGESKTDIWVLWTVLFIAILGAGFMIYKRFGLVRAIAEAEEEFAAAEHEERVEAARKEKEDKINMLKDLRNL